MSIRNVLVVGAGIAGSTLAYWLARDGFETTVVERAEGQRSSGSPVDVRGDGRGCRIGWIPTQSSADALEVPRSDLAVILNRAARGHVDYRYGDSVLSLHDDGHGVDVTFERAAPQRFDLVVGADGLHSRVRRLTFGPESRFHTYLGLYIATTPLGEVTTSRHTVIRIPAKPSGR